MYSIYVLVDNHHRIRYVGRVKVGREKQRLNEHIYRADRNYWIYDMKSQGLRPSLHIIDSDGSLDNEEFYTIYLKYIGCDLSNKYSGRKKSKESIKKQSDSLKESYSSGRIKPPYEKGCKKDPSIGRKLSQTLLKKHSQSKAT
jgi:hypothetical protein